MKRLLKYTGWLCATLLLLLAGPLMLATSGSLQGAESWRTATRASAEIAPRPDQYEPAVVQIYGARAWSWRGYFAVHTWIATKEAGANQYRVHEVTGWRHYVVSSRPGEPDRHWYGARPELYADIRGDEAQALIPAIEQAVQAYPYVTEYEAWPGPNSNTFTAWVIREVPGLDVALPSNAIGKDYLGDPAGGRSTWWYWLSAVHGWVSGGSGRPARRPGAERAWPVSGGESPRARHQITGYWRTGPAFDQPDGRHRRALSGADTGRGQPEPIKRSIAPDLRRRSQLRLLAKVSSGPAW